MSYYNSAAKRIDHKHESRFPWNFGTIGTLQIFPQVEKKILYFSSNEFDYEKATEEINGSTFLTLSFDFSQQGAIRIITVCCTKCLIVVSLVSNTIQDSLKDFLKSLNNMAVIGNQISAGLEKLNKIFHISLNAKDINDDPTIKVPFTQYCQSASIPDLIKKSEQDLTPVVRFESLYPLSNQVMSAIVFPAVLIHIFLIDAEKSNRSSLFQSLPSQELKELQTDSVLKLAQFNSNNYNEPDPPFELLKEDPNHIATKIDLEALKSTKQSIIRLNSPKTLFVGKPIEEKSGLKDPKKGGLLQGATKPSVRSIVITRKVGATRVETPPPAAERALVIERAEPRIEKPQPRAGGANAVQYSCRCPLCSVAFPGSPECALHIITGHGLSGEVLRSFERENAPRFVCSICSFYAPNEEGLFAHAIEQHPQTLLDAVIRARAQIPTHADEVIAIFEDLKPKESVSAEFWLYTDRLVDRMLAARAISFEQGEARCNKCGRVFGSLVQLIRHCVNVHSKD